MDGAFKSENILADLGDDYLTLAPFGPSVLAGAVALVNAKKQEFMAGKTHVFAGPLKDNRGSERMKAGTFFPLTDLGKMDWLVEWVIGQPRWSAPSGFVPTGWGVRLIFPCRTAD